MGVVHGYHCVYDTHYHVVFPVKHRKALLGDAVRSAILGIADGIAERYDIEFERIGTDGNHIHVLCSFHPKYAGGEVVGLFKSMTAKQLFRRFPEMRRELWGGEFWSDGYYIATVSERGNWDAVSRYVERQGKTTSDPAQLKMWR
jgi:putative transposase